MVAGEVITLVENLVEEDYTDSIWLSFMNMGLDDLTPVAKILKRKTGINVVLTGGCGEIDITTDSDLKKAHTFLQVFTSAGQLRRLPMSDQISQGWKLITGKILVQGLSGASVTCSVDYYCKLEHVASASDDIETVSFLPVQYHHLLVLFCAVKSQQKEEELEDKADYFNEYQAAKNQMIMERLAEIEPHKIFQENKGRRG